MSMAKLDAYNYMILPGVIRISLDSSTDPILVDILSEIDNSKGVIYVEGRYYEYLDQYYIFNNPDEVGGPYLDLLIVEKVF